MASLFGVMGFLLFLCMLNAASSAKIAGLSSMASGSHYFITKTTLEELASRGHEVVLVVSSDVRIKPSEKIPHKIYKVPYEPGFSEDLLVKPALEENQFKGIWELTEVQRVICECLLNSTELLKELKDFDLIVYEGAALCAVLVGDMLGIPRVVIAPGPPNAVFAPYHMIPTPVSYIPQQLTGFSCNMTFIQRVINLGTYFVSKLLMDMMFNYAMCPLKVKYNITPELSYNEAIANVELVIILADFALEFAQPLLPGVVMVGPIGVKKPKPLPPDLQEFIDSAGGDGFIIVSFGSYVEKVIAKKKIDKMATAFAKLRQKVLWRLLDYIPPSLGPNIKLVSWLPQNDLLAHKDIKAFVSHVGHNSLYESAYHGVPVVAVPLFADQIPNAKKAEQFGLGVVLNHEIMDAEQLFETIQRVINKPRFKKELKEATRISRLMKDNARTPLEKTGDWIEYVLRHGGARHLRAQVFNIPWYQYYLLDVKAFLVAMFTLVVMVMRLTCRCLCRVCCKENEKEKLKKSLSGLSCRLGENKTKRE